MQTRGEILRKKRKKSERESQTGLGMDIKSHQFFAFSLHLPMRPFIFRLVAVPSGQTIGPRGKKKRIPHTEKEEEEKKNPQE
jgi:hypothetical protein